MAGTHYDEITKAVCSALWRKKSSHFLGWHGRYFNFFSSFLCSKRSWNTWYAVLKRRKTFFVARFVKRLLQFRHSVCRPSDVDDSALIRSKPNEISHHIPQNVLGCWCDVRRLPTLGVKIRMLKVDFKTGGTWCRVGQWTLIMNIYDFFIAVCQNCSTADRC